MSRAVQLTAFVVGVALVESCRSHDSLPTAATLSDCLSHPVVSPAAATLHIGDTLRVLVSTSACPGRVEAPLAPYTWSSNDSSVAKVNASSGLVVALHDGNVTIVATSIAETSVKGAMELRVAP